MFCQDCVQHAAAKNRELFAEFNESEHEFSVAHELVFLAAIEFRHKTCALDAIKRGWIDSYTEDRVGEVLATDVDMLEAWMGGLEDESFYLSIMALWARMSVDVYRFLQATFRMEPQEDLISAVENGNVDLIRYFATQEDIQPIEKLPSMCSEGSADVCDALCQGGLCSRETVNEHVHKTLKKLKRGFHSPTAEKNIRTLLEKGWICNLETCYKI